MRKRGSTNFSFSPLVNSKLCSISSDFSSPPSHTRFHSNSYSQQITHLYVFIATTYKYLKSMELFMSTSIQMVSHFFKGFVEGFSVKVFKRKGCECEEHSSLKNYTFKFCTDKFCSQNHKWISVQDLTYRKNFHDLTRQNSMKI